MYCNVDVKHVDTDVCKLVRSLRKVLQVEHDLKQWRVIEIALRVKSLDQNIERHVRMSIGVESYVTNSIDQCTWRRVTREIRAKDQVIHEKADLKSIQFRCRCRFAAADPTIMSSSPAAYLIQKGFEGSQ